MRTIIIYIISIVCTSAICQDVEQKYTGFKEKWIKDPISVNSSVGFNSTYFNTNGTSGNDIPFMYNIFGNVNLDVLGIALPVSFFYSNQNIQYNLPAYKFVGLSPSYRGHTLLLGDRTMHFSPYSLAGIGFTGVGAESINGRFTIKGMYGRLNRATIQDIFTLNNLDNTFHRIGWAIGGEYKDDKQSLGLHLFQAKDDPASLPLQHQENITPQAGSIILVKGSRKFNLITIRAEYAYNLLTKNLNTLYPYSGRSVFELVDGWHKSNSSTGSFNAFNSGLDLDLKKAKIGLAYERIDPGYVSLGALFFNNDMETISGNLNLPLFKGKINSNLSIGMQRNNLSRDQSNDFRRLVTSVQSAVQLGKTSRLNLYLSNFKFNQKSYLNTQPFIQLDTLVLTQNNLNTGIIFNQHIKKSLTLVTSVSHNRSNAIQGDSVLISSELSNTVGQLYIQKVIEYKKIHISSGINYSILKYSSQQTSLFGPSCLMSIEMIKDIWKISISENLLFTHNEFNRQTLLRTYLSNRIKLLKSIDVDLQLMYLNTLSSSINKRRDLMVNALILYQLENKVLVKSFKRVKQSPHEL